MSKDDVQIRILLHTGSYLGGKSIQLFRADSVGTGLVSDERSAKFKEYQSHWKNVARSGIDVKKV